VNTGPDLEPHSMPSSSNNKKVARALLLPQRRLGHILVMAAVFAAAFAARLYKIDQPPLDRQPTRQYRSLLIARGYYFRTLDAAPEWEKHVAARNLSRLALHEPPITEYLVSLTYRVVHGEHFWVSRSFCSLFWVIGGVFCYLIARKIASPDAALLCTVFYLFLPYGIKASRTFQPDPLMIMVMLASLYAIVCYAIQPSLRALLVAAIVSALAIVVKPPMSFFPIFGAFIAFGTLRRNILKTVLSRRFILFAFIALLPCILYGVYGMFVADFLRRPAENSIFPQLLLQSRYWRGWSYTLSFTVGYRALCGALLGLILCRNAFARALLIGLWVGYVVFGLVFTCGIRTHAYYHLILIPIIGLSLTPLADVVLGALRQSPRLWLPRIATWVVLLVTVWRPLRADFEARAEADFDETIRLREEVGEVVGHSAETIIFDRHFGSILKYHGKVSGDWWPSPSDLRRWALQGRPVKSDEDRLDEMIEKQSPEFFIIVAASYGKTRKKLSEMLAKRYRTLTDTDDYIIFDLKKPVGPSEE